MMSCASLALYFSGGTKRVGGEDLTVLLSSGHERLSDVLRDMERDVDLKSVLPGKFVFFRYKQFSL